MFLVLPYFYVISDFVMIGKHQETNNNKKNSKYKKFSLIQPESNVNNVQQNSKKQLNSKTTRGFGFSDVSFLVNIYNLS